MTLEQLRFLCRQALVSLRTSRQFSDELGLEAMQALVDKVDQIDSKSVLYALLNVLETLTLTTEKETT